MSPSFLTIDLLILVMPGLTLILEDILLGHNISLCQRYNLVAERGRNLLQSLVPSLS